MSISLSRADGAPPSGSAPPDGPFSIGDMARAFNVSQRTLRFYEDRGLLTPRRDGSARLYGAGERRKLELILRGKRLGFTLTEIIGFVADKAAPEDALALDPKQIAQQIAHLQRQRDGLDAAIAELRATQGGDAARLNAAAAGLPSAGFAVHIAAGTIGRGSWRTRRGRSTAFSRC